MKLAIPSKGKNLEAEISEIFARAPFFLFVEIEEGEIKKVEEWENQFLNQLSGVGMVVGQFLGEKKIDIVIVKNIGPRASEVLKGLGIKIFRGEGKIRDILQKFIEGKLKEIE